MLRVILVDDERLARQGLRHLFSAHPEVKIVGEAARVRAAEELIRTEKPDAVFLDIKMPGQNGFELLKDVAKAPKVVFVTAYAKHAVQAFDVHAVDYLLKPVSPLRLADAIARLTAVCKQEEDLTPYQPGDQICLRTPQRTAVTTQKDLVALEADGDFTRFHIEGQAPLLVCRSLRSCEESLPHPPFVRLSRSLMINLDRMASLEHPTRDGARMKMTGSDQIFDLGRRALGRLKKFTG